MLKAITKNYTHPSLILSISMAVFAPSFSFSATSPAFDLVDSRVSTSSTLSNMFPCDVANSLNSESSKSFNSFLFSLKFSINIFRTLFHLYDFYVSIIKKFP